MYLPTRLPETETRDAETSDPVALTLLRAAQVIRERGWCQGGAHDGAGRMCAVGAIKHVADHEWYRARCALSESIGGGGVMDWNDTPGRTADEVISALERAALSRATAIRGV